MKALVVDDQSYVAEGIIAGVDWEKIGVDEVFAAYSGSQAMQLMKREEIRLVITDIEMPVINGIELANWILSYKPDTAVLFLTAHADFAYAQQAVRLGCCDYIVQPVDYKKLEHSLAAILKRLREKNDQEDLYDNGLKWKSMKKELEEHFWNKVIFRRPRLNLIQIEEEARKIDLNLDWQKRYRMIAVRILSQRESLLDWSDSHTTDDLNSVMKRTIEEVLPVVSRQQRDEMSIVYLIPEECDAAPCCRSLIEQARRECGSDVVCYLSEAGEAEELAERAEELAELVRDQEERGKLTGGFYEAADLKAERSRNVELREPEGSPVDTVERIKEYVRQNLERELSRQEIADHVYMSKDYISHLFKKSEGVNLIDYINAQKMECAKRLLEETGIPVNMVALKVGIPNYAYFSKLFKKSMGMSATEYRELRKRM